MKKTEREDMNCCSRNKLSSNVDYMGWLDFFPSARETNLDYRFWEFYRLINYVFQPQYLNVTKISKAVYTVSIDHD